MRGALRKQRRPISGRVQGWENVQTPQFGVETVVVVKIATVSVSCPTRRMVDTISSTAGLEASQYYVLGILEVSHECFVRSLRADR